MAEYDIDPEDWGTYSDWGYDPSLGAGAFSGGDQFFLDNQTGETYSLSQIYADPQLSDAWIAQQRDAGLAWQGGEQPFTGPTSSPTTEELQRQLLQLQIARMSPQQQSALSPWLAGGAVALPSLLGLAGLIQGMTGGGTTTKQITQPSQSPLAGQAGQAALQGFQGAQQFGFGGQGGGLAGQLQGMAPYQQGASMASLQGLLGQQGMNPFLAQQPGTLGTPGTQQTPEWANAYAKNVNNTYGGQQLSLEDYLRTTGTPGTPGTPGGNPLLNQLAGQVQGYGQAQGSMLDLGALGALGVKNPAAGPLGMQAQGMAMGNLPALSPMLRAQVAAAFEPGRQDINRYLDQSLQQALERSRQQGFAGGNEVFREGTPGTILAPMWAEGMRQQGALGGLQAQAELGLAQSLPMQGGNLANQLFQQQLGANQGVQNAAAGYTVPMSVALGGGLNLSNLNQNILQALGGFGQQGITNQLDFLRAISAPLSGLSGLSGTAQAGAGSTTTQNQPFSLLNAFAPTASLLGGIGGAMAGYGALSGTPNRLY